MLHCTSPSRPLQSGSQVSVSGSNLTINAALAVREGLPESEAIKAITINAAEIIGVEDRVGSLEVGKDADIVIFSGHPFDYQTIPELVMVNGKIYKQ